MRFPSSKYTKMRLQPRTPLQELTALPRSPSSWLGGAYCPPPQNPTLALGPAGLEFSNFGPWSQRSCASLIYSETCDNVSGFVLYRCGATSVSFLTCVSHTAHVIDIGWTSVCLSVTRWYCVETAQPIVKLSSLPGSPMILVFWDQTFSWYSNGNTHNGGVKCKG